MYLPGADSTQSERARAGRGTGERCGRVHIEATAAAPGSRALLRALARASCGRCAARSGWWPVPGLAKATPFGFHGHLAGTLPMRVSPSRLNDANGRLSGTRRVSVADSAVFPTLPAQNLTFTAMADALRIGAALDEAVA